MYGQISQIWSHSFTAQQEAQKRRAKDVERFYGKTSQRKKALKEKLVLAALLPLARSKWLVILNTDACDMQIDVLMQEQPGWTEKPISYWSGILSAAVQKCDTKDLDCLAVV